MQIYCPECQTGVSYGSADSSGHAHVKCSGCGWTHRCFTGKGFVGKVETPSVTEEVTENVEGVVE